jgi:tellurite methyltransferase
MGWDERWAARGEAALASPPCELLTTVELPGPGRALDVAGGAGRNGVWLADRGWDVTVVDGSREALKLAAGRGLWAEHRDLELMGLPYGPWDLLVSSDYLQRSLFAVFPTVLTRGGLLVFAQPTTVNLERHPRPSARFLLQPGELGALVPSELELLRLDEDWRANDRHEAWLVARRR